MEEEAPHPDEEVAHEADEKDGVMAVFAAGLNAQMGVVEEEEVGERVDYLGGIWGCVVVLQGAVSGCTNGNVILYCVFLCFARSKGGIADFFAPIDGRGDWIPIAGSRVGILD